MKYLIIAILLLAAVALIILPFTNKPWRAKLALWIAATPNLIAVIILGLWYSFVAVIAKCGLFSQGACVSQLSWALFFATLAVVVTGIILTIRYRRKIIQLFLRNKLVPVLFGIELLILALVALSVAYAF